MSERNVEFPTPIKAHNAIKAGTIQKEKIERFTMSVKSLPDFVVKRLSYCFQALVDIFKVLSGN